MQSGIAVGFVGWSLRCVRVVRCWESVWVRCVRCAVLSVGLPLGARLRKVRFRSRWPVGCPRSPWWCILSVRESSWGSESVEALSQLPVV